MRLSVDNINQHSPYWVIQLDDMTFRFVTENGVKYRVGFFQDEYFLGDKAYHFFIDNEENVKAPRDLNVFRVIACVIEEFFSMDRSVMLYICDPHDHRQAIRAGLYKRWFVNYPKHDELTLRAEELNFDGYIVYTGMILRKDHPEYNYLLDLYSDFVRRAETFGHIDPK